MNRRSLLLSALALAGSWPAARAAPSGSSEPAPRRPFRADSPWNLPIPPGARYREVSSLAAKPIGLASWLGDSTAVPIVRGRATDPLVPVLYAFQAYGKVASGRWRRFGNPPAVEAEILRLAKPLFPYEGNVYSSRSATAWILPPVYDRFRNPPDGGPAKIRLPAGARPNSGYDGQLVVYQPDGMAFESYATIVLAAGAVVSMAYRLTDPRGLGDGRQNGLTASMVPTYAGVLTRADLASGEIRHALSVKLPGSLLATAWVYPAYAFDRDPETSAEEPYAGTVPMGGRLAIPATVDLAGLALETALGRMIARSAQTYGLVVVDRGSGGITLNDQMPQARAASPALRSGADLVKILRTLRRVSWPGTESR